MRSQEIAIDYACNLARSLRLPERGVPTGTRAGFRQDGTACGVPTAARTGRRKDGAAARIEAEHSAATAWLEGGVHIKAVADLLGHSSIAITGDLYAHSTDDTARAAVAGFAEKLGL